MRFVDLLEFKIKENGRVYFSVPITEFPDSAQKAEILECIKYFLAVYGAKDTKYAFQYRDINIETLGHYGIVFTDKKPEHDIRDWLIEQFLRYLTVNDVREVKKNNNSIAFILKVPTKGRFKVNSDIKIPRLYIKFQFIYGFEKTPKGTSVFFHPSAKSDYILISPDHMILNEISFHRDRSQIKRVK